MVGPEKFLATLLADWHSEDYMIAVIDDLAEAEQAEEALWRAGWATEDTRLFRGYEIARHIDAIQKRRRIAERIAALAREMTSYESILGEDYQQEVLLGHQILAVYTPGPEQIEQARSLLLAHHAHDIEHFGIVVITSFAHERHTSFR
jgi:hypothetical protein